MKDIFLAGTTIRVTVDHWKSDYVTIVNIDGELKIKTRKQLEHADGTNPDSDWQPSDYTPDVTVFKPSNRIKGLVARESFLREKLDRSGGPR
jgi:hypothetical protein